MSQLSGKQPFSNKILKQQNLVPSVESSFNLIFLSATYVRATTTTKKKNQPQSYWLNHEGAVALLFDEVMNVKYGNLLRLHKLFIEEKLTPENFHSVKASII